MCPMGFPPRPRARTVSGDAGAKRRGAAKKPPGTRPGALKIQPSFYKRPLALPSAMHTRIQPFTTSLIWAMTGFTTSSV